MGALGAAYRTPEMKHGSVRRASILFALVSAGCAAGDSGLSTRELTPAELASAAGFREAAEMLEDGQITSAEYDAALALARGCMEALGAVLSPISVSPVDGLRRIYTSRPSTADPRAIQRVEDCSVRYQSYVEAEYARERSASEKMEAPLLENSKQCLRGAGVPISRTDSNAPQMIRTAGDQHRGTVVRCILDEGRELYPALTLTVFV
jgi:hypothetical protein